MICYDGEEFPDPFDIALEERRAKMRQILSMQREVEDQISKMIYHVLSDPIFPDEMGK